MSKLTQNEIVNFLKQYGFIYANSEIYNGLSNAWDYGPLGVLLKNNLKNLWWKKFVTSQENIVGLDTNIIYNSNVWKASGHINNFSDPLIDCKQCNSRLRADKLIEDFDASIEVNENDSNEILMNIIDVNKIPCPMCKKFDWTPIRKFNLMFKTFQGVTEESLNTLYLRPETAQGIFINFKNVQRTSRMKIPFGIAQIGKAFRNEITPGNFIFRTREFEQMEIEYFIHPTTVNESFNLLCKNVYEFMVNECCLSKDLLKQYIHPKEKLSHYSSMTLDYQFNFPHGWSELCGIAHRGNYDLTVHQNTSGKELAYHDPITNEKFLPHVVEPSIGVDRLFYAIIINHFEIQSLEDGNTRELLKLPLILCPYKIAILPLTNKLNDKARDIYKLFLNKSISCTYDSSGSIGKRYRRQDAMGTMYCLTIDFETLDNNNVTLRQRDNMEQEVFNLNDIDKLFMKCY